MIDILRIQNGKEAVMYSLADDNASVINEIMGREEVNLDVVTDIPLDLRVGDYVRVAETVYTLNREPNFEKVSAVEYKYDLLFEGPLYRLMDKLFVNSITSGSNFAISRTLEEFVKLVVDCINTIDPGWSYAHDIPSSEPKVLTIDAISCRDVLSTLSGVFDVEFYLVGKEIHFVGRIENNTGLVFEQGKGKGLYSISQQPVDNENTVTRVYPYGGTQNVMPGKGDAYGRVCLPEKFLENFSEYSKIVEKEVEFTDIFPRFKGSVESVSGEFNKVIKCDAKDLNVNDYLINGTPAKINFLSGDLMGESFDFLWNNVRKEITLKTKEDASALADADGNKPTIPNANKKAERLDTFNFIDINMPESYYGNAVEELRQKATEWLTYYSQSRVKYALQVDYRFLRGKRLLKAGDLVTIKIPETGTEKILRITSLDRNLKTGKVNCTVSNYLEERWEKKIEGQIKRTSESSNSLESGLSTHLNNTAVHLVEGDREVLKLLSIDEQGRLKVDVSFYSVKGISAYGPSLSEEGGSGILSVLNDLTDVNDSNRATGDLLTFNGTHWVTVARKSIETNLTGYATEVYVNTRINNIVDGAPAAFDTLKEIADVLQGNVSSIGDILTALGTKWTQDNALIADWNAAYANNHTHTNKSALDGITAGLVANWNMAFTWGNHAFSGYLKASDFATYFKKDSNGRIYTDLDFYSTKSVSAYGSGQGGSGTFGNLGDLIDVNDTGKKQGSLLMFNGTHWVIEDGTNIRPDLSGYATQAWVNGQGFLKVASLTAYATKTYVNSQGFLKADNLTGYATETWVRSNYLTLSGNASSASLVVGTYTGGGGAQPPSYVPSGRVRFNMMNLNANGDSSYKDWILMDTYTGGDVPFVTGIGVNKSGDPRAFIMSGPKGSTNAGSWVTYQLARIIDNVASASKLHTPRALWGQPFDGTANVSGALTGVTTITTSGGIAAGGNVVTNGLFSTTANGCTLNIGSANTNYVHFNANPSRTFYFSNGIAINGTITPYLNDTFSCGGQNHRWSTIYGCNADFTGLVSINPATSTGKYTEGIRVGSAPNNWSLIILGAVGNSGTSANSWLIGKNPIGELIFDRSSSAGETGNGMRLDTTGNLFVKTSLHSIGGWFSNNNSGTGLYNIAHDARWSATANGWTSDKNIYTSKCITAGSWFYSTGNTGWFNETHGGGIYMVDSTWIRTYGGKSFYCDQAIQANRFYTGYDAGVSASMSCSNWFRSNGNTGWLNDTHGGGWYMTDATYLRSYGSKSIYTGTGYYLAAGTNEVFTSANMLNNGRYRVEQTSITPSNCLPVLSWSSSIAGQGYIARMGIGSYRPSGTWGRMYFSIGTNDAGTSSVTHYMDQFGIQVQGDLSMIGTGRLIFPDGNRLISSGSYIGFLTQAQTALSIAVGGITVSDTYSDISKRPAYGIYSKGNIISAGELTAYSTSDMNLKTNFKPITDALDVLKELSTFHHTWNAEAIRYNATLTKGEDVGMSAQQIQKHIPSAVRTMWGTKYLGVNYVKLIPLLTAGINELASWKDKKDLKIEELERRVKQLENQLNIQ